MLFVFISCKKTTSFPYSISGVRDFSISKLDTFEMPLTIEAPPGTAEDVTLSISKLPTGIYAYFTPGNGKSQFSSTLKLYADYNVPAAGIPLTITAGSAGDSRSYNFTLNVLTAVDCATPLVGSYAAIPLCTLTPSKYTTYISTNGVRNRINIANFGNTGITVYADLDWRKTTITIPKQALGYDSVFGSGNYIGNSINIIYTLSGMHNFPCSFRLAKQ